MSKLGRVAGHQQLHRNRQKHLVPADNLLDQIRPANRPQPQTEQIRRHAWLLARRRAGLRHARAELMAGVGIMAMESRINHLLTKFADP